MQLAAKGEKVLAACGLTFETVGVRCDVIPEWYRDDVDERGRLPALKRGKQVWVGAEQVLSAIEAMVPRPALILDDAMNRPALAIGGRAANPLQPPSVDRCYDRDSRG